MCIWKSAWNSWQTSENVTKYFNRKNLWRILKGILRELKSTFYADKGKNTFVKSKSETSHSIQSRNLINSVKTFRNASLVYWCLHNHTKPIDELFRWQCFLFSVYTKFNHFLYFQRECNNLNKRKENKAHI